MAKVLCREDPEDQPKVILETTAVFSEDEARAASQRWRQRLAGRMTSDSSELLREDRDR
ncbi:MAG TPA: hypothetical protein VFR31_19735 [Thermoanaerobaculia bacterium]|nr:hypothetical protein [Thermoanaerobaculia bacterium]